MSVNYLLPMSYHEYLKVNASRPLPEFLLSPPSFFRFRPWNEALLSGRIPTNGTQVSSTGLVQAIRNYTDDYSETKLNLDNIGSNLGNIFSSGLNSAGNSILNNVIKGDSLLQGVGLDALSSVAGSATGLASNLIGLGISNLGGNSKLSKGIGQGIATGLGTVGGTVLSNLINTGRLAGNASKLFGTGNSIFTTTKTVKDAAGNITKASLVGAINPYALGAQVVGQGLQAAFGPSKEYEGRYGGITKGMDTAYDAVQAAIGFVPGWGQMASGIMALNKGLSNVFGSTSGMTKQDAILGSAFMPAPVKWLNMAGAKTTGSFNDQSWLNTERTNAFMGNAFGNLSDKFDKAREEAGKTYGTFSHKAYNKAQNNLNFANNAWDKILAMTDLNELLNIRSQYMTSINNQRYALNIQGGWSPLYRGKQGMKILNNATNHNMGMRLLSSAALIDDKQMILSAKGGTKAKKKEDDHIYEMEPMLEVVVTAKRKYIAGYDKNGNPIYTENPQESMSYTPTDPHAEVQASMKAIEESTKPKYTDAIVKAAQGLIGAPLATIAGAPIVEAVSSGVGAAAKALAPGSSFWMNPITKQMVTGTAMSEGVNLANKAVSGYNTVGEGVGDLVQRATGWNPNNTWLGPLFTEALNPGWYVSPNGVMNTVGRVGNVAEEFRKPLINKAKWLYNEGKIFNAPMKYNPDNFYRKVGKEAIEDANNTGLIRANPNGSFNVPFFGYHRSNPSTGYTYKNMRIIEGTPNSAEVWADSWRFSSRKDYIQDRLNSAKVDFELSKMFPEDYGKKELDAINKEFAFWKDLSDNPIRDVRKLPTTTPLSTEYYNDIMRMQNKPGWFTFEFGTEAFPSNSLGVTEVPTTNFTYWRKYPLLGWRKNSFRNVKTPTITAENAASITPEQWTAAQDAAITRGDMAEAQRLRDLHFRIKSRNDNEVFAHSTKAKFTKFDKSHFGETDNGFNGKGFYFTNTRIPDTPISMPQGPHGEIPFMNYGKNKMYVYLKGNREFGIGDPARNFFDEPNTVGITSKYLYDRNKGVEVIVGNPNNIKLADAVTYDDNGVRIPLGDRDNFNINDIRWGLLPFAGITGAATLNNKSK